MNYAINPTSQLTASDEIANRAIKMSAFSAIDIKVRVVTLDTNRAGFLGIMKAGLVVGGNYTTNI